MGWKSAKNVGLNYAHEHQQVVLRQQRQIILLYAAITVILFIDRWRNEMLLSQIVPPFFVNRMDAFSWALMFSGVHKIFIGNFYACFVADALLILLPLLYTLVYLFRKNRGVTITGWIILVFNFIYVQCYVLYPTNSIEGHIGWMLFPVVLICRRQPDFGLALKFIRYVLLFFFVSAGIWKIRNGGLFNLQEMSGILLYQHKDFLVTSPDYILTNIYYWLAGHPQIGYALYISAAVLELFFIVGFFTTRFDRWLVIMFFIFLVSDMLVMRIKYWEILYLVIPLLYSRKEVFNNTGQSS